MKRILPILALIISLPAVARDFSYTHQGQTLTYTVIDETAKTCQTRNGSSSGAGNNLSGELIIPETVSDGSNEYTVVSIGSYAFNGCSNLEWVEIPQSVTSIGNHAFYGCTSLLIIDTDFVTSIGENAFSYCSSLLEINIGADISIGDYAFSYCSNLLVVGILYSVTNITIGEGAFKGCSGITLGVEEGNDPLTFNLQNVDLNSVTTLDLGRKVVDQNGKNIHFPNIAYLYIGDQIEEFDAYMFSSCGQLRELTLGKGITTIGNNAFSYCTGLTSITIPESVTTIGDYAFHECSGLTSVKYLCESPCTASPNIFPQSVYNEATLNVPVGSTDTYQSTAPWSNFSNITEEPFPYFKYTYAGQTVTYEVIDKDARTCMTTRVASGEGNNFSGDLILPAHPYNGTKEYTLTKIGNCFMGSSDLNFVSIPEGVTEILPLAFNGCTNLEMINIPSTMRCIGEYAFNVYKLDRVNFSSIESLCNIKFMSPTSNPIALLSGTLYINNKGIDDALVIPDGVRSIGDYAFYNYMPLISVSIPSTVDSIGRETFANCWSLSSVKFSGSVSSIGTQAFSFCSSLKEIQLPPLIKTIEYGTFECCGSLNKIVIHNHITEIGEYAFRNCDNLDQIIIGNGTKTIGERAFYKGTHSSVYCTTLTPPSMSDNAFSEYSCTLYVPASVASVYASTSPWNRFTDLRTLVEATSITLNATNISGNAGDTFQLTAKVSPDNTTLKDIVWRSTNPEIATVDSNGLVTLHCNTHELHSYAVGHDTTCQIIAETLYANGPMAVVTIDNDLSDIDAVESDQTETINYSMPYDVYNMQGVWLGRSVDVVVPGLYIVRQADKTHKSLIK